MLRTRGMRLVAIMVPLLAGCSLYFGSAKSSSSGSGGGAGDLYHLTVDRRLRVADGIYGIDADQQGGLWLALQTNPPISLVHLDPATNQTATLTYDDLFNPLVGLALVDGQIWLNYQDDGAHPGIIRVIDPATGVIVGTRPNTMVTNELSAMGSDRALLSDLRGEVAVADSATGAIVHTFSTAFASRQIGIAWRPGEIWVAGWDGPEIEIYDEAGTRIGTIALDWLGPPDHLAFDQLAFDRGQLVVAQTGEVIWLTIS
jgi:hypothetical protein